MSAVLFALAVSFVLMMPMFWLPADQTFLVGLGLLYLWMLIGFKIRQLDDLLASTAVFSVIALVLLTIVQTTIKSQLWVYLLTEKLLMLFQTIIFLAAVVLAAAVAFGAVVTLMSCLCGAKK